MNGFFSFVIFLIILALLIFCILYYFIFRDKPKHSQVAFDKVKKKSIFDEPSGDSGPVDCGSISILFDADKNAYIIPYVKDLHGEGKAAAIPKVLAVPYSMDALGAEIKNKMRLCKKGIPLSDREFVKSIGNMGWKEFSEGKRNISVHYKNGHGIIINSTRRKLDGSYQFNKIGFDRVLSGDASDNELGEAVLEILKHCKV